MRAKNDVQDYWCSALFALAKSKRNSWKIEELEHELEDGRAFVLVTDMPPVPRDGPGIKRTLKED